MATIHFYEKPGCINNTRQKKLLSEAGHRLVVHDLLQQSWANNREKLRSFFGDMPVRDWFNRSAPAIKNGEIDPELVSEQQAIDLMVEQPLLIRRPLLELEGQRHAGFESDRIQRRLGLATNQGVKDLETCRLQQPHSQGCRS